MGFIFHKLHRARISTKCILRYKSKLRANVCHCFGYP